MVSSMPHCTYFDIFNLQITVLFRDLFIYGCCLVVKLIFEIIGGNSKNSNSLIKDQKIQRTFY